MRIPHLIELWGVEQNRPSVLENGLIRGGFGKSGQKEFHRPLITAEVVQRHRQKDLERSIVGKRRHRAAKGFLRRLICSSCPIATSQSLHQEFPPPRQLDLSVTVVQDSVTS